MPQSGRSLELPVLAQLAGGQRGVTTGAGAAPAPRSVTLLATTWLLGVSMLVWGLCSHLAGLLTLPVQPEPRALVLGAREL